MFPALWVKGVTLPSTDQKTFLHNCDYDKASRDSTSVTRDACHLLLKYHRVAGEADPFGCVCSRGSLMFGALV